MPVRKRRRMDSFEKLPSLHWNWSSSSDQDNTAIYERHTEDQSSLQDSACAHHGPQDSLSSGLEVLPPAGQQVETLPVSPAPGHNNSRVDGTPEGNILSRYEIGRMLGEGGYGSVFEGKRLEDGLEVAVKIARKPKDMKYIHIAGHPAPLPLEVGLLILVNNGPKVPEIIELLDWQDQPDQYILVLERPSPCKDLWDFLNFHDGTLNEDTARFIMTQTTMAAHVCCRRGVFHRDIKLENLLINTETYEVKLIDFGCGDLLQESGYEKFRGTVDYRPPEYRTEGKYHGKPATVWSLGVLLFLLVCGRFPERRDRRMIDDNTWSMPGLSNECCHLIRSLLQESPRQRIDLREILQHEWFKDTE
ncbi:serine/threonine-protein kinase pim-1-like [Pseudorasbora parva]|uniref:serine/threonine-protein kinase pim-1-like n=2 Tax=Pseudorasbora parva TaxID=51549 RepID=UPI00351F3EE4